MSESEYNRDQRTTLEAVNAALARLSEAERDAIRETIQPYLRFRDAVDRFFNEVFLAKCTKACFETGLSACCGFESIITFASDHAINLLFSEPARIAALIDVLRRPNLSGKCVYLGPSGCLWSVRPISCAMFLCGQVKSLVFGDVKEREEEWSRLQTDEKAFTFPDQPVLFDSLESRLIELGVESPHLFFHRSPGLLLVKEKAGLWKRPPSLKRRSP